MRLILPATTAGTEIAAVRPGEGDAVGGSAVSARSLRALAELYAYPPDGRAGPWLRANMISSADGAASLDGRSGGLSGGADRAVFAVLRSLADVILVGAGTARAERYQPVRRPEIWPSLRRGRAATPAIAVVTRALDLDPAGPLLAGAPGLAATIVLTTRAAAADRVTAVGKTARVLVVGESTVDPGAAVAALAGLGHQRILVEGGPGLLGQIAAAGLLDELCLTISPMLAGGSAGRIIGPARRTAEVADGASAVAGGTGDAAALPSGLAVGHVMEDDGFLLCRYVRQRFR